MINYSKISKWANIKYQIIEFYNKNKIKIYLILFFIILSLFTGVFTAIKLNDLEKTLKYSDFGFEALMEGDIYKFSFLAKRILSAVLVMALLWLFSINKFLNVLGYSLIIYRGFLISLNITLIVMHLGLGGIINGIIIILPCKLLELLIISLFFVILTLMYKQKNKCGKFDQGAIKNIIAVIIASILACVLEWILLLIFKATTILII